MNIVKEDMDSVSVIILTNDRRGELKECLNSVFRQSVKPRQVIVIDNGSSDGTVDFLKKYGMDLEIIANSSNVGFGKAMNQGLRDAKGLYSLFLATDIVLSPDYLEIMLAHAKNSESAGMVSGCLYDYYNKDLVFSGSNVSFRWGFRQSLIGKSSQPVSTDLIIGAIIFAKTSLMRKLRGFDERYFFYFEDLDLSLRFKKAGYRNLIIPQAAAYHMEKDLGMKKYTANKKIQFELEKNLLITYFKHARLFWLLTFFLRYMSFGLLKNIFNKDKRYLAIELRCWALTNVADLFKARYSG